MPYDEDTLRRLYIDEGMSTTQVAKALGLKDAGTISRALRRYGIPARSIAEGVSRSWNGNTARKQWAASNLRFQAVEHYEKGVATRAVQYRANPTPSESVAIDYLSSIGEPFDFQVQFGVYIADFVLPRRGQILEIDTGHHNTPSIAARDAKRDEFLAGEGYCVLRVPFKEESPHAFLRKLTEAVPATLRP